jgi:hypothetical protein
MAQKHGPMLKLDKDIAEKVFGHRPGRPTMSRRAGRQIADAFGIGEHAGTDLFHAGLFAVGLFALAKVVRG